MQAIVCTAPFLHESRPRTLPAGGPRLQKRSEYQTNAKLKIPGKSLQSASTHNAVVDKHNIHNTIHGSIVVIAYPPPPEKYETNKILCHWYFFSHTLYSRCGGDDVGGQKQTETNTHTKHRRLLRTDPIANVSTTTKKPATFLRHATSTFSGAFPPDRSEGLPERESSTPAHLKTK